MARAAAAVRTEFRRVAGRAGSAAASRRTSCATHTRLSWPAKVSLSIVGFCLFAYLWSARIDRASAPSEIVDVKKLITLLPLIASRPM